MEGQAPFVLLFAGGGGSEHEISLRSAQFISQHLDDIGANYLMATMEKDGRRLTPDGDEIELRKNGIVFHQGEEKKLNFVIPCFHGFPGETGNMQALFDLMGLPFLGTGFEASVITFNKILTKLFLQSLNIATTPFTYYSNHQELDFIRGQIERSLKIQNKLFLKASNQGSSVGCFLIDEKTNLNAVLSEALNLSDYILVEHLVTGRELEVATFEYQEKLWASTPGEILTQTDEFYSYDEKYSDKSQTITKVPAENLEQSTIDEMQRVAKVIFQFLHLRDLSRIDFFLTDSGQILVNEINTFPGMTSISLFPKMMSYSGVSFSDFLSDRIRVKSH